MKKIGIYIHIPFCIRKCIYCDFKSYDNKGEYTKQYVNTLAEEIRLASFLHDYQIKSIFIGGGTPTCLEIEDLYLILSEINNYKILEDAEISIEVNPGTVDYIYLKNLKQLGINRISFGLQSASEKLLKILGRIHTYKEFLDNYENAFKVGFKNINIDLMFGLPKQSIDDWQNTLCEIISLKPQHISAYNLIVEEETEFGRLNKIGKLKLPEEELDREMYYSAKSILEKENYNMYEISNFAKIGYESVHNKIYWNCEEYIGFGLAAHSYFNGRRFSNTEDFSDYLRNKNKVALSETLSQEEAIEEFIFLGLRMADGIGIADFENRFGKDLFDMYGDKLMNLISNGYISEKNGRIILTEKGIYVSNAVFAEIL